MDDDSISDIWRNMKKLEERIRNMEHKMAAVRTAAGGARNFEEFVRWLDTELGN